LVATSVSHQTYSCVPIAVKHLSPKQFEVFSPQDPTSDESVAKIKHLCTQMHFKVGSLKTNGRTVDNICVFDVNTDFDCDEIKIWNHGDYLEYQGHDADNTGYCTFRNPHADDVEPAETPEYNPYADEQDPYAYGDPLNPNYTVNFEPKHYYSVTIVE